MPSANFENFGSICAVVVTYNIGKLYEYNFNSYVNQLDRLIIVDNGSDEETVSVLKSLAEKFPDKVEIIFNTENLGLAKAQNDGIKIAIDQGYNWVLLLDHDSSAEPKMIASMVDVYQSHPEQERIGILAPYFWEAAIGKPPRYVVAKNALWFSLKRFDNDKYEGILKRTAIKKKRAELRDLSNASLYTKAQQWWRAKFRPYKQNNSYKKFRTTAHDIQQFLYQILSPRQIFRFLTFRWYIEKKRREKKLYMDDVLAVIASGSLIKSDVMREIGLMKEDFFIDYIDSEFCLRAAVYGYSTVVARNAVMHHALGDKKRHKFLWIDIITSNHSVSRRYTIYRNRIRVWRMYRKICPPYIMFDMIASVYEIGRISVFEKNRKAKLKAILRGIKEGLADKVEKVKLPE